METIAEKLVDILNWIGSDPFKLLVFLSVFASLVIYFFFKSESPAYKLIAVIILFFGIAVTAYRYVAPNDVSRIELIKSAFSDLDLENATKDNLIRNAGDEKCLATSAAKYEALTVGYPNDQSIRKGFEVASVLADVRIYQKQALNWRYLPGCEAGGGILGWNSDPVCGSASEEVRSGITQFRAQNFAQALIHGRSARKLLEICASNLGN